jgi:iron complex transport system substrate-binding protein
MPALPTGAACAPRVLSLDQCADQFVMALSPREAIVGLSMRADDADSRLRANATGLPKRRVDLETVLAAQPDVVVRYWGGEPGLLAALNRRKVRILTVDEAKDFAGIRANIRRIADGLRQHQRGAALIAQMDVRLTKAQGAWAGRRALYLTPGGVTAGQGTLVDAILSAAGLNNVERRAGFQTVSLEALALEPPSAVVLGFFDTLQASGDSFGAGRHQLLQRLTKDRAVAHLPGSMLGCPNWSAAEAVEQLAAAARP